MTTQDKSRSVQYYAYPLEAQTVVRKLDEFNTNDVIEMFDVADGWRIVDIILSAAGTFDDINVSVGDGGDTDRFITSTGVTGTTTKQIRMNVPTDVDGDGFVNKGSGYLYTADDTIDVTIGTADSSASTIDAVLTLTVFYYRTFESASERIADTSR